MLPLVWERISTRSSLLPLTTSSHFHKAAPWDVIASLIWPSPLQYLNVHLFVRFELFHIYIHKQINFYNKDHHIFQLISTNFIFNFLLTTAILLFLCHFAGLNNIFFRSLWTTAPQVENLGSWFFFFFK